MSKLSENCTFKFRRTFSRKNYQRTTTLSRGEWLDRPGHCQPRNANSCRYGGKTRGQPTLWSRPPPHLSWPPPVSSATLPRLFAINPIYAPDDAFPLLTVSSRVPGHPKLTHLVYFFFLTAMMLEHTEQFSLFGRPPLIPFSISVMCSHDRPADRPTVWAQGASARGLQQQPYHLLLSFC